jgi:adenosylmethionine-8-amino-7-oxononanoate aminotransferase
MIAQPDGWLAKATRLVREHGAQLVADEVMTGFGRTGNHRGPSLFACGQEGIQPDFLCVAKGLAGGYLPLAATLTTQEVFNVFLGRYDEFKTFFHGHSFTGNPLAAATALASVQLLSERQSLDQRLELDSVLQEALESLWSSPFVGDIRQVGLVAGIELVRNWRTREAFRLDERAGIRVCDAMARRGVLTRPIGNVIVLMPPYCTTARQLKQMVAALRDGIDESLGRF